jgi:ADP-ribose pyrophosphatase
MGITYPKQPHPAVGTVVFHRNQVLLVLRQNPPSQGLWSLPGGVVRLGEHLQQAAEREVFEETSVVVKAKNPIYTFDVIRHDQDGNILYHYVIVDYLATFVRGNPCPNDDALEARWVSPSELINLSVVTETRNLLTQQFHFTTSPSG